MTWKRKRKEEEEKKIARNIKQNIIKKE